MKELFTAIRTSFAAGSTFNTAIGGRLNIGDMKQSSVYPYAVYDLITGDPDRIFDGDITEYLTIQFSLISNSTSVIQVNDLFDKLKTWFDDVVLTVAGYQYVAAVRGNSFLQERDNKLPVFTYIIEYEIILGKT